MPQFGMLGLIPGYLGCFGVPGQSWGAQIRLGVVGSISGCLGLFWGFWIFLGGLGLILVFPDQFWGVWICLGLLEF